MICFAFSAVRIDNPEYLITSPVVYRVGKEEKVTVLLVGSKSCEVEVRLRPRGSTWTAVRASGTFEPGERGILKLEVKYYKIYSLKNELINTTYLVFKSKSYRLFSSENSDQMYN